MQHCCCGAGSIPIPGTFMCCGRSHKKKRQDSVWVGPRLQAQCKVVSTGFPPKVPSYVIPSSGRVRVAPHGGSIEQIKRSNSWFTAEVTQSLHPPALASRVSHRNFVERYELLRRLRPGTAPSQSADEGRSGEGHHCQSFVHPVS